MAFTLYLEGLSNSIGGVNQFTPVQQLFSCSKWSKLILYFFKPAKGISQKLSPTSHTSHHFTGKCTNPNVSFSSRHAVNFLWGGTENFVQVCRTLVSLPLSFILPCALRRLQLPCWRPIKTFSATIQVKDLRPRLGQITYWLLFVVRRDKQFFLTSQSKFLVDKNNRWV